MIPSNKCDHLYLGFTAVYTAADGLGNWIARCGICLLSGDWCKNPDIAKVSFYDKSINKTVDEYLIAHSSPFFGLILPGENMSNADYKRGVEDTVREILENLPLRGITDPLDVVNSIPRFVREKLLTKKVTKWVNVYNDPSGTAYHYDTKEEALGRASIPGKSVGHLAPHYLGTFPLEIKVPL